MGRRVVAVVLGVVLVGLIAWVVLSRGGAAPATPDAVAPSASISSGAPDPIRPLFDGHRSDVEVESTGTVSRTLPDDDNGSRHQRFILELADGLTVLVAHNIDIAPRLDGLRVGDRVEFRGEYVWSDQGGTVHWTHHDPSGGHEAGWLRWQGRTYG